MPKLQKEFETVIDYRTLRARRAWLGLEYAKVVEAVEVDGGEPASEDTLARLLRGDQTMTVNTIVRYAAGLGLRPRVIFEPIEEPGEVSKTT